jgi:CBS domain-containing protein
MRAREVMTKSVFTVTPETTVRDVAKLLVRRKVSAVPVVDKAKRVIGIVSEGDLLRRRELGTAPRSSWWLDLISDSRAQARDFRKTRATTVGDVMARPVTSVEPDADLIAVADILDSRGVKRVPVVQAGKLVGIISRGDLVRALAKQAKPKKSKQSDAAIGATIQRRLQATSWTNNWFINTSVNKGAVELSGLVKSDDEREAVRVLIENVPGVRSVKNRLGINGRLTHI